MKWVIDTHTQSDIAGDFLTFFDAVATIRFPGILPCALSIIDHMGVPSLMGRRTSSTGQTLGKSREEGPHACSRLDHLTWPGFSG